MKKQRIKSQSAREKEWAKEAALKIMVNKYGPVIDQHIAGGGARPLPNPEDLPDPTCEHIAELGRWIVHEGMLGPKQIAWTGVIGYASSILRIAWAQVDEATFNKASSETHPLWLLSKEIYQQKRYWAGDPVIEELKGDKKAIENWLRKVGMWREWQ